MKQIEAIKSNCPECGKRALVLREKDIYCNNCQRAVLHEIPKTSEGDREAIKAIENYVKESLK